MDVLRGKGSPKILERRHNELSTFGILSDTPRETLISYVNQLIDAGVLDRTRDQYPVLRLTATSADLLRGKVEMMLSRSPLFEQVAVKHRLFRKITPSTIRGRLLAMTPRALPTGVADEAELIGRAFEEGADAKLVLDHEDVLVAANSNARSLLSLSDEFIGQPFQDLEISYRPVDLRSAIDEVRRDSGTVRISQVARWTPTGDLNYFDITLAPLSLTTDLLGVAISFVDVTPHRELQEELEQTPRELEVAYEELQSSNEELETTNEELQSTIEELETTNEELQSTNEELETMNEELSSTNEELQAINEELRERTTELDQVNAYLQSVLTGLNASVVVLDRNLDVQIWNGRSFEMGGLRSEEAEGRSFLSLDVGFPVEVLRQPLRDVIEGGSAPEAVMAKCTSRRGEPMHCMAQVSQLVGANGSVDGAIVVIEVVHHNTDDEAGHE